MDEETLNELINELLESPDDGADEPEDDQYCYDRDRLLRVLDENKELRDECFYTPETILVYTEETETLEAVEVWELPLRFPLQGKGARWCHSDLGEILEAKATLYRQSRAANDLAEDYPDATPECGTPCLVVPEKAGVMSWCQVKAQIDPALNR